ncbi:hypothetical protein GN956_G5919 [Arapaima gigas]
MGADGFAVKAAGRLCAAQGESRPPRPAAVDGARRRRGSSPGEDLWKELRGAARFCCRPSRVRMSLRQDKKWVNGATREPSEWTAE